MKRKKPIKRTPIKRSSAPIAKRSKKTEKAYVERRKIVAEMLAEFPLCFACPIFAKHDGLSTFIHKNTGWLYFGQRQSCFSLQTMPYANRE
jgi:hypothetical protein